MKSLASFGGTEMLLFWVGFGGGFVTALLLVCAVAVYYADNVVRWI